MTIRDLTSIEEFEACMDLQREGFERNDLALMPIRFYVVTRHVGGLVLGAFDGNALVGFLSTIPGIRHGTPYWHSHMLAITSTHRGAGIGTQLKLAQKERALKQALRELFLAQSSDWAFIMKTGTHVTYAQKRTKEHLLQFTRLYEDIKSDNIDEGWLAGIEYKDNLFPDIDYRVHQ